MLPQSNRSLNEWVDFLAQADLPVFRSVRNELDALKARIDRVNVNQLSQIVMNSPLLAVRVMSWLSKNKRPIQNAEVTTINGVLMMIGIGPFFHHFGNLSCVEDILKNDPVALACVSDVINRARFASDYAYDFAELRFDINVFEVRLAALLSSTAEIMLWCFAPSLMKTIRGLMLKYRNVRSAHLQQYVLGFSIKELQKSLAQAWGLPELMVTLLDDSQADNPRVRTVTIASDLARHSAYGLDDPALPDDYINAANLLTKDVDEILLHVSAIRNQMKDLQPVGLENLPDSEKIDAYLLKNLGHEDWDAFESAIPEEQIESQTA